MASAKRESTFLTVQNMQHHRIYSGQQSSSDSSLDLAIQVLMETPKKRKDGQLQLLASFMTDIKLFKELADNTDTDAIKRCCMYLTYDKRKMNEAVFHQGDTGTKFYIVLSGCVGICVKTMETVEIIDKDSGTVHKKTIQTYKEVKELFTGESFGELALITNGLRAATVRCKSDCHFAVLDKADYIRILGRLQLQHLDELVEFLQSLPLFQSWGKLSTQRISYYFTPVKYIRKQCVYRCRDIPTHVYIIKSGEFEFSQDIAKSTESIRFPRLGKKLFFTKFQVTILGKGEVFGDSELIEGVPRVYTCACISSTGLLLVISKEDFEKRILVDEDLSKLTEMHAVKARLREARVKKVISLNSEVSSSQPVSPVRYYPSPIPTLSIAKQISPIPRSPGKHEQQIKEKKKNMKNWLEIVKKFSRKKTLKGKLPLPKLNRMSQAKRLAGIQHNYKISYHHRSFYEVPHLPRSNAASPTERGDMLTDDSIICYNDISANQGNECLDFSANADLEDVAFNLQESLVSVSVQKIRASRLVPSKHNLFRRMPAC